MPTVYPYNRNAAVEYAMNWALKRNPRYYDFSKSGGDCTNFASQCLYAGSNIMNYTPVFGWYYNSVSDRTASWSGVQFLYNFLITNKKKGVFASEVEIKDIKPGDIIQLGNDSGHFYHSLVVTKTGSVPSADNILICTHTYDSLNNPLSSYVYGNIRFLHIEGVYL